jgi:hypothetical protein
MGPLLLLLWFSYAPPSVATLDWLVGCSPFVLRLSPCEAFVDRVVEGCGH